MELIARLVLAPSAVDLLISGVLLARAGGYGLATYWWVLIKLTVASGLTLLAGLVLVPALADAADAAARLAPGSTLPDGQRFRLLAPAVVGLPLLALSLVLAVYRPRWRLPRQSR